MEKCNRTYIFGLAPGVFARVSMIGPRPVEEQPDPVPDQALQQAQAASARARANPRTVAIAQSHRAVQPWAVNQPLWFDPPLWTDSTSELPAIKKPKSEKDVDNQIRPGV